MIKQRRSATALFLALLILQPAASSLVFAQSAMVLPDKETKDAKDTKDTKDVKEPKSIKINPGDVVSIAVFPVEEYSREVTVQPDGKIELQLIGSIMVKGLTSNQLQDLLQQKYSRFVSNPQVTVNVRRFAGRRVAIIGEIRSPGYYEYREGMRILELISTAGGLTENAKASKLRILRPGGTGDADNTVYVNFKAVLAGKMDRDVAMAPGDTVYVPKRGITAGAAWINNNILPWTALISLVGSAYVISDRR